MQNRRSVPRITRLAAAVAVAFSGLAGAQVLPQGEVLRAGAATVSRPAAGRMEINQTSARAAIDWQSFSVGQGGAVNISQPSSSAWLLSRVVGVDPSVIAGSITANGGFTLVNPNGVLFTPTARLDVGSLIASTAGISVDNFMAGRMVFDQVANRQASIVNQGEINAAEGGLVALVAPGVANSGKIQANLGRVALGSGHAYTLDLFGDQLISFAMNDKVTERVTDINGTPLRAYLDQAGRIEAQQVVLSANAAKAVLDNVVNMSGVIRATGVAQRGGEVVLSGDDIRVTETGVVDVSGTSGGRAVLVANDHMQFDGLVNAKGSSGPGGFVEISGKKTLAYNGDVLMSAGGSLLFDPTEITIDAAMATTLGNTMRAGALATVTTSSGDLVVGSPIYGQGGSNGGLTLTAGGTGWIIVDAVIVAGGPLTFNATGGGTEFRHSVFTNSGNITLNGLGVINPAGDEIGFNPSPTGSILPEDVYTGAQFNASSLAPSRITGAAPARAWDAVNAKITISTDSGNIMVNNGLVHWADPLANRAPASMVRWYNGVDTTSGTPARSTLPLSPLGWLGVNLVAGGSGTVTLNGNIGFSAGQIADAMPSVLASPDTTFKILAIGGTLNGSPSGAVNTLIFNSTVQPVIGTLAYTATDPNHNGQLIPPAPSSAGLGSAAAYISELNLTIPPSAGGATAGASAAQEAAAVASSVANQTQQIREEAGGSHTDVGGRGPGQSADLGRSGASGGAGADVFGQNFHVADGNRAGPNADREYFSETPFQSAERRRRR